MCTCKQKSKVAAGTPGNYNYVYTCKDADGKETDYSFAATSDRQALELAELLCPDKASAFGLIRSKPGFDGSSQGTTILAYAEADETFYYIYPELYSHVFYKVKKTEVNQFKKRSAINHDSEVLPIFLIDLKSDAILEKTELGSPAIFQQELNISTNRWMPVQLARIAFNANGEGTITFNGNSYPCLGNPGIKYPVDLTVNTTDKYRTKFSQEFQVTMEFAILIWGQRGIYIHYGDDTIAANGGVSAGCIHVEEPQIESFYNWITGPTRITISYPW